MVMLSFVSLASRTLSAEEGGAATSVKEEDTDPWAAAREERIRWWAEARFGMFIHWGLYAIPAGEWQGRQVEGIGEWIMHRAPILQHEYRPLKDQFNPTRFDANAWVRLMKEAGCRYFVITTKHHDGFALYRSQVSDYDVAETPFGRGNDRDIMRELADAARKHGIRIGWYHSIMDWNHPDYLPRREWDKRPTDDADFDRYREYLHAQVGEILSNYGPIDVIWFDGEWQHTWTHEYGIALHEHCMSFNPKLLVNNRVDDGRQGHQGMSDKRSRRGDFGTPEQNIPAEGFGPGVYWESCMTMNDTWGYKSYDDNWKSTTTLIRNLINTASKGGNYLLNVGPTALGEIPEPSVLRLKKMGEWLEVNGESIYGTKASAFESVPWGRITVKPLPSGNSALYLHVFDVPESGRLLVPGLTCRVIESTALGVGPDRSVKATSGSEGAVVTLANGGWNEHASVIKLVVSEMPTIKEKPLPTEE